MVSGKCPTMTIEITDGSKYFPVISQSANDLLKGILKHLEGFKTFKSILNHLKGVLKFLEYLKWF